MARLIKLLKNLREKRFIEIAKTEATPKGFYKYQSIAKGPIINGVLVVLIGLFVPFYVAWRLILGLLEKHEKRLGISLLAIIFVIVLTCVYWNHFDNGFYFDDSHTIVNNAFITDISNLPSFFIDSRTETSLPLNQSYRPVITSLNAIDYWIAGGLDPRVFHWHIYINFLVLLLLLYFSLKSIFESAIDNDCSYIALFATALFGLHTATAETINYIIARSDGFSTLMVMAGFLLFIKTTGWKRQLGLIPFVIGCLAKPTTLMLAPILLVYCALIEKPSARVVFEKGSVVQAGIRGIKSTGLYFVIGVVLYVFTRSMYSDHWTPGGHFSGLEYLNTQAWVIWIYIKVFFLPTGLTADTDLEVIRSLLSPRIIWGVLVISLMLTLAWWCARRRHTLPVSFGILWFFIALIPSSSIIPLAEVMNHHRTYFPYIGLVMAFSWLAYLTFLKLSRKYPRKQVLLTTCFLSILLLSAHAWGTCHRNEVWGSAESLWKDVTEKSPNNGRGLMNYGLALMNRGAYEEAIENYQKALATNYRNHPYLMINLGIATNAMALRDNSAELLQQAEEYLRSAVDLGPSYPETHYRYAHWLYRNDRVSEALQYVNRALELAPANKNANQLRDRIVSSEMIEITEARRMAEEADTPESFLNLSLRYFNVGDYQLSIWAARKALELRPDYALAYNNICSAHNMMQQYAHAISACEKALEIDPDFERARNNLRWATEQWEGENE